MAGLDLTQIPVAGTPASEPSNNIAAPVSQPQGQQNKSLDLSSIPVAGAQPSSDRSDTPDTKDMGVGDYLGDVAASGVSGAVKGLGYGVGTVGDIRHLAGQGINAVGTAIGASPEGIDKFKRNLKQVNPFEALNYAPTSDQVHKFTQENITGDFYKPQTRAGRLTGSAAEFAANPVSYLGPGSAAVKAGMAVAGGLGSEVGREAGEATGFPGAETAGSIAGSLLAPMAARRYAVGPKPGINDLFPTNEELFARSHQRYDLIDKMSNPPGGGPGLTFSQGAAAKRLEGISEALEKGSALDINAPMTHKVVDWLHNRIAETSELNKPLKYSDIATARSVLGDIASSKKFAAGVGPQDSRGATIAIKKIDDWMASVRPHEIASGHSYLPALQEQSKLAMADWGAAHRAKMLDDLAEKAGIRAAVTGTGANKENKLRQKFAELYDNKRKLNRFSDEEKSLIREVAEGTFARNTFRLLGKTAITGIVSLMGDLVAAGGNKAHALALGAAGHLNKRWAEKATEAAMDRARAAVRSRSPLYQEKLNYYRNVREKRPSIAPLLGEDIQRGGE